MMIELHRRPFTRPLLIWITGILLYVFFSYQLLTATAIVLSLVLLTAASSRGIFSYVGRWGWGCIFVFLLLALSVLVAANAERRLGQPHSPKWMLEQLALERQQQLVDTFDNLRLEESEKNVLATLTLGYRQAMDKEMNRSFALTGVSHILSVSGYHTMVVCTFLSLLLWFVPRNGWGDTIRCPLMILLLWGYVWLTGLSIPAVRAGLMMSLYLVGQLLNRNGDSYNTLAASAFCMLVYQPFYLFDIGFQLSYVAVWFILYLQPRLDRLINVHNPLLATPWGWITTTIAAQLGTTFLCLYYFGQFSTVFLFTNLPLMLISSLLIPLGLVYALLPAGWLGHDWLQASVEWLVRVMVWIVERFAASPVAAVRFDFGFLSLLAGYTVLFLFLAYGYKRRPWILLTALVICFLWLFVLLLVKK